MPEVLTRKIGPLPAWAWGGLAAAAVWFFFLRGKGASSSTTKTTGQAPGDYSLGYAQGLQAAVPPGATPTPMPTATTQQSITIRDRTSTGPFAQYDAISPGVPVYLQPGGPQIGTAGFGSVQKLAVTTTTGLGATGRPNPAQGPSNGFTTTYWGIQYGPATGWIGANDVAGSGPSAVGGPARKHAGGSRQSAPMWHDAHPLIGAPVKYPHFVRAVGGAGNHAREIHRVAHQAGIHPARIAMLNPKHTGMIRVA